MVHSVLCPLPAEQTNTDFCAGFKPALTISSLHTCTRQRESPIVLHKHTAVQCIHVCTVCLVYGVKTDHESHTDAPMNAPYVLYTACMSGRHPLGCDRLTLTLTQNRKLHVQVHLSRSRSPQTKSQNGQQKSHGGRQGGEGRENVESSHLGNVPFHQASLAFKLGHEPLKVGPPQWIPEPLATMQRVCSTLSNRHLEILKENTLARSQDIAATWTS